MKSINLGRIGLVSTIALLLIAMVLGVIDTETMQSNAIKAAMIIGIAVLTFVAITAIASNRNE